MKKSIRRMAVLFAALFVVAMVTSVLFIALEAEHDCIGEDCPVCLQIAVCHSILNLSAGAAGIVLLAAFRRWIASSKTLFLSKGSKIQSPIRLKVKLLN